MLSQDCDWHVGNQLDYKEHTSLSLHPVSLSSKTQAIPQKTPRFVLYVIDYYNI